MAAQSSDQEKNQTKRRPNNTYEWIKYQDVCEAWWDILGGNGEPIFECWSWALVEEVVHELCLRAVKPTIARESKWDREIDCAMRAWALEYFVCQRIGIPIEKEDAVAGADIQQVPYYQMRAALESPWAYDRLKVGVLVDLEVLRITFETEGRDGIREIVESTAHDD
jgi:hypothetical protein